MNTPDVPRGFDDVSEADLPVCLIYEYSREAERALFQIEFSRKVRREQTLQLDRTILDAANDGRNPNPDDVALLEKLAAVEAREVTNGRPATRFQFLRATSEALYASPPPWHELTADEKRKVRATISHVWYLHPTSGACEIASGDTVVRMLQTHAAAREALADTGRKSSWLPSGILPGVFPGDVVVPIRIDFANWSDDEIADAFKGQVEQLRNRARSWFGDSIAKPAANFGGRRAGTDVADMKAALDNLRLMRIRAATPRTELRSVIVENCSDKPRDDRTDPKHTKFQGWLDSRLRRVRLRFRAMFPELGPNAKPECDRQHP